MELRSRNKVKFKYAFTDKTKVQNSPMYRGVFLWNQLSSDLQHSNTITEFKSGVRQFIESDQLKYGKGNI